MRHLFLFNFPPHLAVSSLCWYWSCSPGCLNVSLEVLNTRAPKCWILWRISSVEHSGKTLNLEEKHAVGAAEFAQHFLSNTFQSLEDLCYHLNSFPFPPLGASHRKRLPVTFVSLLTKTNKKGRKDLPKGNRLLSPSSSSVLFVFLDGSCFAHPAHQ